MSKNNHTFAKETTNYKPPYFQNLVKPHQRILQTFKDPEYVKPDNQSDVFNFGSDEFKIQDVYNHYYHNVSIQGSEIIHFNFLQYINSLIILMQTKRYQIQAFMDLYLFDVMKDYTDNTNQDEIEKLTLKTKKVAQLAQKLFNLKMLEDRLLERKQMMKA